MNKLLTIHQIRALSKPIFQKYKFINKAYLFGSYAKNIATSNSDIDIVVKLDDGVGMRLFGLYDDFENIFNKRIDLLTENEIMEIMPKVYKRDRILIYEKC